MVKVGATVITPKPVSGRVFIAERRVQLGDISPNGLVRFDALARYLQDIARDDSADAAYPKPMAWVARRTLIETTQLPRFQEWLNLATWCSGFGGRWAERSTEIRGDKGGVVNAVTVWVYIDERTGMPRRLSDTFHRVWGVSSAGRRVSARLVLSATPSSDSVRLPWSMRVSDLDVMNHMNNAAYWSALEEAAAYHKKLNSPTPTEAAQSVQYPPIQRLRAELEHIAPVEAHNDTALWAFPSTSSVAAWLTADGTPATSALLSHLDNSDGSAQQFEASTATLVTQSQDCVTQSRDR